MARLGMSMVAAPLWEQRVVVVGDLPAARGQSYSSGAPDRGRAQGRDQ